MLAVCVALCSLLGSVSAEKNMSVYIFFFCSFSRKPWRTMYSVTDRINNNKVIYITGKALVDDNTTVRVKSKQLRWPPLKPLKYTLLHALSAAATSHHHTHRVCVSSLGGGTSGDQQLNVIYVCACHRQTHNGPRQMAIRTNIFQWKDDSLHILFLFPLFLSLSRLPFLSLPLSIRHDFHILLFFLLWCLFLSHLPTFYFFT